MKIGVYVGSFNPVHKAHIALVKYLLEKNYVDKVVIVATGSYWDKKSLVNILDRVNMLKYYESENIIIDNTLNNVEYTYQILEELKKRYSNDEFYLIIGADNVEKLYLWKNIDAILENKILVIPRDNIDIKPFVEKYEKRDNFIVVNDFSSMFISSSSIVKHIKENDFEFASSYLDEFVLKYIIDTNLYRE